MSRNEMRDALAMLIPHTISPSASKKREDPQPPPETLLHPWNPGARCISKADLVGEVDQVCLDVTNYDMVYVDDLTPIRNQIATGAAALLFVAGGAECSLASAWAMCPALVSPCLPDVPVPDSGGETIDLNVPTCFHLCDLILQNCIWEMLNIFGYDNETAHATLRCAQPQGNILFYGNTTYDIFPAAPDPQTNNTIVQEITVMLEDEETGNVTTHVFNHTHECYDGTIGNLVDLAVLNCPNGLVRDKSTGFCHFECPEPLVTSSEYEALKALVTLGACISIVFLTVGIVTYCVVPVLRLYPNNMPLPLFFSLMGIALSLLLGAVDGYHEGTWCSDSGKPNEWGSGTCTVQGIGIVYFSYSSALWWLVIIFHLAFTRGIPTFRKPKQATNKAITTVINIPMKTQRDWLSIRIPFEWLFIWARRSFYTSPSPPSPDPREDSDTSSSSSSYSDGIDADPERLPVVVHEWPSLPRYLQRKLARNALGIRVYFYTLLAHLVAWGVPVIPVIIGLSAKRIGYGGADLWCTVHSGADISFRVTTGEGVTHDQEHETNPWLLGLYIAPIFAILLVGSLLVCIVILSGCSMLALVFYRSRMAGVAHNAWAFTSEYSRQIRLVVFSSVFLVVYLFQLLWLAYFSAVRPEQYDKFSEYMLCSFGRQGPTENAFETCDIDRIVDAGFWGFTALLFASIGVPVALVFLARPEPLRWCWHLIRHCRPLMTVDSWKTHIDGMEATTKTGSEEVSTNVTGRSRSGVVSTGEGNDYPVPIGGDLKQFQAMTGQRVKLNLAGMNVKGNPPPKGREKTVSDATSGESLSSSEQQYYNSGTEISSSDAGSPQKSPSNETKMRRIGRSSSRLEPVDIVNLGIGDNDEGYETLTEDSSVNDGHNDDDDDDDKDADAENADPEHRGSGSGE